MIGFWRVCPSNRLCVDDLIRRYPITGGWGMATIVKSGYLTSNVNFSISFNDTTMRLTNVAVTNNSAGKFVFECLAPTVWSYTINSGGSLNQNIPTAQRPIWRYENIEIHPGKFEQLIRGFEWRCSVGS